MGSVGTRCNPSTGNCTCKPNFVEPRCGACIDGKYGSVCSTPCDDCNGHASTCSKLSGICDCCHNFTGLHCVSCQAGLWGAGLCKKCRCNSDAGTCNITTGACDDCAYFSGAHCDRCAPGLFGPICTLQCTCSELDICDGQTNARTRTGRCIPAPASQRLPTARTASSPRWQAALHCS